MTTLYISIILNVVIFVTMGILIFCLNKNRINIEKSKKEEKRKKICSYINYFIEEIKKAENLYDLYVLHIQLWGCGIRCSNLGPNEYGMFRTKDILTMKPYEVYLGNIWGLFTKPLPFWNTCSETDQALVLQQYKTILLSNLEEINRHEKV